MEKREGSRVSSHWNQNDSTTPFSFPIDERERESRKSKRSFSLSTHFFKALASTSSQLLLSSCSLVVDAVGSSCAIVGSTFVVDLGALLGRDLPSLASNQATYEDRSEEVEDDSVGRLSSLLRTSRSEISFIEGFDRIEAVTKRDQRGLT